jgi:hypothetical protein
VKQLHHARVGMAEKTLKNHIANLKAALRHLSGDKTIPARGTPLTPEWLELRKLVNHEMNRYHVTGLMRFASMQGISPKAVDDAFLARYMSYRAEVLVQDASPREQRSIVRAWNACVEDHASWPQHKLTPAPLGGTPLLSWEAFPAALRVEVDTYLKSLQTVRRKSDGTRRRLSKASTVETRLAEIQAFARRAVSLGIPIASLTSLSTIIGPTNGRRPMLSTWGGDCSALHAIPGR